MTSKNVTARQLRTELIKVRPNTKASLKDLETLIEASRSGDYSGVYETRLYRLHGGEYCEALAINAGLKEEIY